MDAVTDACIIKWVTMHHLEMNHTILYVVLYNKSTFSINDPVLHFNVFLEAGIFLYSFNFVTFFYYLSL